MLNECTDLILLLFSGQHAHVSRCEVIGLLGGTFNEEDKVLKVGTTLLNMNTDVTGDLTDTRVRLDLRGGAVQQREYGAPVRDGPSVSDAGLRRALLSGLQRGGLVPLPPVLPPKPVGARHQHAGPVPGDVKQKLARSTFSTSLLIYPLFLELFLTRRCAVYRDDREPI